MASGCLAESGFPEIKKKKKKTAVYLLIWLGQRSELVPDPQPTGRELQNSLTVTAMLAAALPYNKHS